MKNDYEVNGDITTIYLKRRNGEVIETTISTSDLDKVKSFPNTWVSTFLESTNSFYVKGVLKVGNRQKNVMLHRWILGTPKGIVVDHANHKTLDNVRSNLREVSVSQNGQNRKGLDANNTSGARGVSWEKHKKRWRVVAVVNGKKKSFGYYKNFEEAKKVSEEVREQLGFLKRVN